MFLTYTDPELEDKTGLTVWKIQSMHHLLDCGFEPTTFCTRIIHFQHRSHG